MKKLVFSYKRWYFRLITVANLLIPVFLFVSCGDHLKGIDQTLFTNVKGGLLCASVAALLCLICGLTYIKQSFKNGSNLKGYLPTGKEYYRRLFRGILLHALSITIFVIIVTLGYFEKLTTGGWLKYVIYAFTGITVIIGVLSNICIHLFESKNYFQIFYNRHREEDVKEVMENLNVPKKKPASQMQQ